MYVVMFMCQFGQNSYGSLNIVVMYVVCVFICCVIGFVLFLGCMQLSVISRFMVIVWFVVCVVIIVYVVCSGSIDVSVCYFSLSVIMSVIVLNVLICELCMMCSMLLCVQLLLNVL